MPKQLDNEKSSGKDKFRMSMARKAALGFIGVAAVLTGFNMTNKDPIAVPERADAKTEYVAQGSEVEIPGLEKGDTVQIFKGNFILDIEKGNVRLGPSVYNDARNGEDNIANFDGVLDNKIELQNPILYGESARGSGNPNGRILKSTVNGITIYIFLDAVLKAGAIVDAQTDEEALFDTTVNAIIDSAREDGVVAHLENNESISVASTHTLKAQN